MLRTQDGSGSLERSEIALVCASLGELRGEDGLDELFEAVDADGDGSISLREFEEWWAEEIAPNMAINSSQLVRGMCPAPPCRAAGAGAAGAAGAAAAAAAAPSGAVWLDLRVLLWLLHRVRALSCCLSKPPRLQHVPRRQALGSESYDLLTSGTGSSDDFVRCSALTILLPFRTTHTCATLTTACLWFAG